MKWEIDNIFGGNAAGTGQQADTGRRNAKFRRDYYLYDGTAAGTEYATGTADGNALQFETRFAAEETEKIIFVKARRDDLIAESAEKFALTITDLDGTDGGADSGRGVLAAGAKLKTAITVTNVAETKPKVAYVTPVYKTGHAKAGQAITAPDKDDVANNLLTFKETDNKTRSFTVGLDRLPFGPNPIKVIWAVAGRADTNDPSTFDAADPATDFAPYPSETRRTLTFAAPDPATDPIVAGDTEKTFSLSVASGEPNEKLEGAKLTLAVADSTFVDASTPNELDLLVIDKSQRPPTIFVSHVPGEPRQISVSTSSAGDIQGPYLVVARPVENGTFAETIAARRAEGKDWGLPIPTHVVAGKTLLLIEKDPDDPADEDKFCDIFRKQAVSGKTPPSGEIVCVTNIYTQYLIFNPSGVGESRLYEVTVTDADLTPVATRRITTRPPNSE